jgi:general secretion pathway protein A
VDEAHHLSIEVLEEIRLLTNLETAQEKLLQILLVGQPELDEKMDSVNLRQLKQRIALRSQLEPLTFEEAKGYILRRLQLASANGDASGLFPPETLVSIFRHARGIPRLINTICENALINGFARQARTIGPEIVEEVAADFRLHVLHTVPVERQPIGIADTLRGQDNAEVWQAVKTLLQLHDYLQGARSRDAEPAASIAMAPRSR